MVVKPFIENSLTDVFKTQPAAILYVGINVEYVASC